MKKLLPLTAIALHLSISLSVNAQDLPPVEEPILLAELAPPAIPALAPLPALAPRPTAQSKSKPIEPIMALPAAPNLLAAKPVKPRPADPLGDLVHTLMMEPLPLDDLLASPQAPHPMADLARPPAADPLGDLLKPLAARPMANLARPRTADPLGDLARPLAARPMADLARQPAADPLGDLADVLEAPLVLEPVPPASIDPLDGLAKTRAASPH